MCEHGEFDDERWLVRLAVERQKALTNQIGPRKSKKSIFHINPSIIHCSLVKEKLAKD